MRTQRTVPLCSPLCSVSNTLADFRATVVDLMRTAGSRSLYYDEPLAAAMGYHRVNFVEGHHYFMLY